MSSFFLGFCSGIGAIVAASLGLGLVMLLRARDGEDEDGLSMGMRPTAS